MPRAVSMRHTTVPPQRRDEFRLRARRAREHYAGAGCSYWLFEESATPGAYVEFFEARDAGLLDRAHRDAPDSQTDEHRLYVEVDLT